MPNLDVTDIILDPDFCEAITVIRRTQAVNSKGRGVPTETPVPDVIGVVTSQSGDYVRQTDAEFAMNTIMVHSMVKLQGVTDGMYPDIVVWAGNRYICKRCNNWSHFGAGFYAATCEILDEAETDGQ